MQQDSHSNLSPTNPEALQADNHNCLNTVFMLTSADKALLQEHLEQFQDADKGARVIIIERVMGQLSQLRPSQSSFDKKDASKVLCETHKCGWHWSLLYGLENQEVVLQSLRTTQAWIHQVHMQVVSQEHLLSMNHEEILAHAIEASGLKPGALAFLGALQDATTALWKNTAEDDQGDYVEAAKEWSEKSPLPHI